jgi:hypothetical protein
MGQMRNAYKMLFGTPEIKRRLGSGKRIRWDNIKMDFEEIGCEAVDWIHLALDLDRWRAVVNMVLNFRGS